MNNPLGRAFPKQREVFNQPVFYDGFIGTNIASSPANTYSLTQALTLNQ